MPQHQPRALRLAGRGAVRGDADRVVAAGSRLSRVLISSVSNRASGFVGGRCSQFSTVRQGTLRTRVRCIPPAIALGSSQIEGE